MGEIVADEALDRPEGITLPMRSDANTIVGEITLQRDSESNIRVDYKLYTKMEELMPAVRPYIVRQVREVKITAMSPTDAIKLAEVSLSMSEQDNRDNRNSIPVEVDITAAKEF